MKKLLILLFISLFNFSLLSGYTYYNNYKCIGIGDYTFGINAKQLSMGTTAGLNKIGAGNLLYNPSALALFKDISLNISSELAFISEAVDTLYSTDEDNEDMQNNSFNVWDYGNIGVVVPIEEFLFIGAGYYKFWDLSYENNFIIYEYDDDLERYIRTGAFRFEKDGYINKIPIGIACNLMDIVSIGVSYSLIKGNQDYFSMEDNYVETNYYYNRTTEINSGNLNVGVTVNLMKNLSLGGYFETAFKMKFKDSITLSWEGTNLEYTGTIERERTYPKILGINVLFKASDYYNSKFLLDIIFKNFKDIKQKVKHYKGNIFDFAADEELSSLTNSFSYSEVYPEIHNVIEISMGAEHIFSVNKQTRFPVRYGFLYRPSGFENDVKLIAISLGSGIHTRFFKFKVDLDLGFLYGIRETIDYCEGKYPSFITGDTAFLRKIKESFNVFMLSLQLRY